MRTTIRRRSRDLAPFLWKYWHHSRPARHEKIAHVYAKLIEHCVTEHDALAVEAAPRASCAAPAG